MNRRKFCYTTTVFASILAVDPKKISSSSRGELSRYYLDGSNSRVRFSFIVKILKAIAVELGKELIEKSVEEFVDSIFSGSELKAAAKDITNYYDFSNSNNFFDKNYILPYGLENKSFVSLVRPIDDRSIHEFEAYLPAFNYLSPKNAGYNTFLSTSACYGLKEMMSVLRDSDGYSSKRIEKSLLPFGNNISKFKREKIGHNSYFWNTESGQVAVNYSLSNDASSGTIEFFDLSSRFYKKIDFSLEFPFHR